jgi:hypothetical protein
MFRSSKRKRRETKKRISKAANLTTALSVQLPAERNLIFSTSSLLRWAL